VFYLAWLDDVLGVRLTANVELEIRPGAFDFRAFDSPEAIRHEIGGCNASRTADSAREQTSIEPPPAGQISEPYIIGSLSRSP
jgi:hypothetical protein